LSYPVSTVPAERPPAEDSISLCLVIRQAKRTDLALEYQYSPGQPPTETISRL
jgi:hypothetical protein